MTLVGRRAWPRAATLHRIAALLILSKTVKRPAAKQQRRGQKRNPTRPFHPDSVYCIRQSICTDYQQLAEQEHVVLA
jgi:hypothetical protein